MNKFAFYDTETTGADVRYDQVLQAAAILTDDDFEEVDSFDVRSQLARHQVPSAGALKVTGVDPYDLARAPYTPYSFARFLGQTFEAWGQGGCSYIGFNTIRFDEEIMRQMWWETLNDPYITSRKGSTRNDVLIMLRAVFARNPGLIDIPVLETGKRTFRLEHVAPLNGFEGHDAHDALGDVRATIFVTRLVRDRDPDLFNHMIDMGDSRQASAFAEDNVTFRLLGGGMLNPGMLDVCLIASETENAKSKVAWNLSVDPTPFLDLSPEDILAAMRKSGTPFRSIKCAKSPAMFPTAWQFLQHASGSDAPDTFEIDMRSEMIRSHDGFRQNVAEALRLKVASYDDPQHLEEKIYSGFPSWEDKKRMTSWHGLSSWEKRVEAMREFDKPELRQLALRTAYVNAPESLPPATRTACEEVISEQRLGLGMDAPWNTVGKLMAELDGMLKEDPEDAEALNIRKWALETYPEARKWTGEGTETPEDDSATDVAASREGGSGPTMDSPADTETGAPEADVATAMPAPRPAAVPAHFLDGLD